MTARIKGDGGIESNPSVPFSFAPSYPVFLEYFEMGIAGLVAANRGDVLRAG